MYIKIFALLTTTLKTLFLVILIMQILNARTSILPSQDVVQVNDINYPLDQGFIFCRNQLLNSYSHLLTHYDPENLHQLRVSLRRLISLLTFFKEEIPLDNWANAHLCIKKLLKPTNKVRDLYVINTNYVLPAYCQNRISNNFSYLMRVTNHELLEQHRQTLSEITSKSYHLLIHDLNEWINTKKYLVGASQSISANEALSNIRIEKKLSERYKNVMKKIKHILVLDRKNLHKLRVNIKELRYITEIYCQDKKLKKKRLKVLKQLQTQLGIINDTFIAQDKINKIKAHKAPRRYLMKHLKQQRKACFHKLEKYY